MQLYSGSCRTNNAGRIVELIEAHGQLRVGAIGKHINRGTAYVRSLVQECCELKFHKSTGLVRDWIVSAKAAEAEEKVT